MASAKEDIMRRIRSAQKSAGLADHVDVPRDYQREGTLSADELQSMLIDRLEDYHATVVTTTEDELASSIASVLEEKNCTDVRYAPGLSEELFAKFSGTATADDDSTDPRELDAADAVVTDSVVASAQTGTIVLEAGPKCGRRALSLVPDRHLLLVGRDQIVYGIPEVVSQLNPERPATWVSGPSATSDIELERVEGVHGPRDLIVLLIS